jgi:hypothetical protein
MRQRGPVIGDRYVGNRQALQSPLTNDPALATFLTRNFRERRLVRCDCRCAPATMVGAVRMGSDKVQS